MNIKNRLLKLEKVIKPQQPPLVAIKFNDEWAPEQLQQMDEARVQGRMIIRVNFVDGRQEANA